MIAAVLAGGRSRRMGAPKPLAGFAGAPLIERPLAAAREAGLDPVVVAKRDTPLPDGLIEPFPARYEPEWLPELRAALEREEGMRAVLERLGPQTIDWEAAAVRSINTPEELQRG